MAFLKQIALLALAACAGLFLVGCQPSDPSSPKVAQLQSIAVAPSAVSLDVGGMQSLTVIGTFSDGKTRDVTFGSSFASSASSVATVSPTGLVTGVASGAATINVTHADSGKTAAVQVTVAPLRVVSIAVAPASAVIAPGGSQQLVVTGRFNNATTGDVTAGSTFVSSNPAVATVGATGLVSAVAEGSATITATHTATGQTAEAVVTVAVPSGPVELVGGIWSSNYSQVDGSNWKSAEGGDVSTYIDTSVGTQYWWNGVAPGDAVPSYYFGYGINTAERPWGFGTFVRAPNNAAADVSGYANLRIAVWGNDELMNTKPTLTVMLRGPEVGGCTAEARGSIAVQASGVQTYTLPLSGFTLQTPCGAGTVAEALADGLLEVHVQVLGDNVQYVTTGDPNGFYPNGLNVGPISFNNDVISNLPQLVNGVWSSNYSQVDGSNWKSAEGGDVSTYIDTSVGTQYWWNGVAPGDAVPSYYFGYGINTAERPWGFGTFVRAPNNAAADVSDYTNLRIAVWGNDELMNTKPTLTVLLRGPEVGGCTAEALSTIAVQAAGVQTYTLPLSGFTLQTPCGAATVAEALADGLLEVHVQVLGDNVQYVTTGDPNGFYPNGLNVGPISFNKDGGSNPPQPTKLVWSSNYSQVDGSNWKSTEGGDASTYIDTSVGTQYWWNGVAPGDAVPSYYFGYGINTAERPWGFGTFVKAPNNTAADVSGYTNLSIAVWGNDELMNTKPTLTVLLRGPEVGGCTAEALSTIAVQAAGVQTYTLPLAGFTLQTPCGAATVAEALAGGLLEIHVQVLGNNVQYVTTGDPNGFYPNGLNVGPISLE